MIWMPDPEIVFCAAVEADVERKGETFPSLAEVTEKILSEPPWTEDDLRRALNL